MAGIDLPEDEADFYPRPPQGGRQWNKRSLSWDMNISIHALRKEGDSWIHQNDGWF